MERETQEIMEILKKRPDLLVPTLILALEQAKAADVPVEEHLLYLRS